MDHPPEEASPSPKRGRENLNRLRGRLIAAFMLHDYHDGTYALLQWYGRVVAGLSIYQEQEMPKSYDLFAIASDELRNAFDHVGFTASEARAPTAAEIRDELEAASFHLSIAEIRVLLAMADYFDLRISELFYRSARPITYPLGIDDRKHALDSQFEKALLAVGDLMEALEALRTEQRPPTMPEIERTRVVVIQLYDVTLTMIVFLSDLGESYEKLRGG